MESTRFGSEWPRSTHLNDIPVGALVIDLADAAKCELVWRAGGTNETDVNAKPEKRDAAIDKASDVAMR